MRFAGVQPQSFSGGSTGNYSAAAGATGDVGGIFGAMRAKAPRYDQLGAQNMANRSNEKAAAMAAEANVASAGISAVSNVWGAKLQADAQAKALDKQAAAQKSSSIMGGIAGIASAGLSLLSDERTKHSIEELESVTTKLRELRPVTYFYKQEFTADPWRKHHGFIAQEFKHAMPDATIEDKVTGMLSIAPVELIAVLVKGYQELDARLTRCEVRQVLEEVAA